MRKIFVLIPFGRHEVTNEVFRYIQDINSNFRDFSLYVIKQKCKCVIYKPDGSEEYKFYTKEGLLICIAKQIEINMQEFPDKPNATIHY